jgi:drug/metabolite transporter (DMT)-like permease
MTPFRENLRGITAMVLSNLLFLINDASVKVVNDAMPIGQILFLRGAIATVLIGSMVLWLGLLPQVRGLWHWAVLWRTIAEIGGAFFYLTALFHMPIANINAILQVVPLMITAAGAIFLGEFVGWRRWTAIGVGFVGVLIVARPGLAGFDIYSLVALAAMACITLRDMSTRVMPRGLPALLAAWLTAMVVSASGAAYGLAEDWVAIEAKPIGLLFASSIFLIGGYLTSVVAMRHGEIAVVSPFRYSVVIFAMAVGFLIWGEMPDLPMIVGTTIIIATGIYTFYRERQLALGSRDG